MKRGVLVLSVVLGIALLGGIFFFSSNGITGLQIANQPPTQTASSVQATSNPFTLNLNEYFFDPDGDVLTYLVEDSALTLDGSLLTVALENVQQYTFTVTVSDGTNTIAKPFTVEFSDALITGEPALTSEPLPEEQTLTPEPEQLLRGTLETQTTSSTTETQTSTSISGIGISAACGASITECCDITSSGSYTLANNINAGGGCLNITASNVQLDCQGFSITGDTSGSSGNVTLFLLNNFIHVQNCIVLDTSPVDNNLIQIGIALSAVNNNNITNVTVQTNGTRSIAISIENNAHTNRITNSTLWANGSSFNNLGIQLSSAHNNTVENTTIRTQGGSNGNEGIRIASGSDNNTIVNNSISTNGTSANYGISIASNSHNTAIENNTIYSNGTSNNNIAIFINGASNNTVRNNTLRPYGTANAYGINIQSSGDNNTIEHNAISTHGTGSNNIGIAFTTSRNNTVAHNIIQTNGSTGGNRGIQLQITAQTHLNNNTINTAGGSTNYGIEFTQTVENSTVSNNYLNATATTGGQGIHVNFRSTNNTFSGNTVYSGTGGSSPALYVELSNNNTFTDNTFTQGGSNAPVQIASGNNTFTNTNLNASADVLWLFFGASNSQNNFTNTSFTKPFGAITIVPRVEINGTNISATQLNISDNKAFLNGTALSFFNTSANITLTGLSFSNPQPLFDPEDDGTYIACDSGRCTETGYAGGTFTMNVSGFTSYSTSEAEIGCGSILTSDTTLSANLSTTDTCFNITTSNIVIDCAGYNISGNGATDRTAFNLTGVTNVTIRNCNIEDFYYGVWVTNGSNYTIAENNNLTTNTIAGVRFDSTTFYGTVRQNIIRGGSRGVWNTNFFSGPNHIVHNNTISNAQFGIMDFASSNITNNYIFGGNSWQIYLQGVSGNRVENNILRDSPEGFIVNSGASNNIFINNTVINHSTHGIRLSGSSNNIFRNNTFANNTVHIDVAAGGFSAFLSNYQNDVDTSNTADGLPVYYIYANSTAVLENIETKHLTFANEQFVVINNVSVIEGDPITLAFSHNITITNVTQTYGKNNIQLYSIVDSNFTNISLQHNNQPSQMMFVQSSYQNNFTNITFHNASTIMLQLGTGLGNAVHTNTFNQTTFEGPLANSFTWIATSTVGGLNNTFWNTSFTNTSTNGATLNFPYNFSVPASVTLDLPKLIPSFNRTRLNANSLPFLNTTAQITFPGLSFTNPRPLFDSNDDNVFETCNPPQCEEINYAGGAFTFNVTHFSSYAASETVIQCGDTITTDTNLTQNLTGTGTCLTIGADNIMLDCNGHTINYSNQTSGYAINVTDRNNITIANCNIGQINRSQVLARAIFFSNSNHSTIQNNTISTGTASNGVYLQSNSQNNTITNNTILSNGGASNAGVGVETASGATNTIVTGNVIRSLPFGNPAIFFSTNNNLAQNNSVQSGNTDIWSTGQNNTIRNNSVSGSSIGIQLFGTSLAENNVIANTNAISSLGTNNTFRSNTILLSSTALSILTGGGNLFVNNTVLAATRALDLGGSGTNTVENNTLRGTSEGIFLGSPNNRLYNNTVLTPSGTAIYFNSQNNTLNLTTLSTNNTWIFTESTSSGNNFTNTNFTNISGSIFFDNFTMTASTAIGRVNLSIGTNNVFLSSANLSFLNTSAQITLNGITQNQAQQIVDFEDDGSYIPCVEPDCTFISYDGSTLVFNVSHFTSFSSTQGGVNVTLEKTDSPDPVNLSQDTLLNYTINFTVTDGAAFNITINETYPDDVDFITSNPLPTTGNFSWDAGNLSIGSNYEINITINVSSALPNGYVINNTINATYQNSSGDALFVNVTESTSIVKISCPGTITVNTTLTEDVTASGTCITIATNNLELDCAGHVITYNTGGASTTPGIQTTAMNTTVRNCIIVDGNASGANSYGIYVNGASDSHLENNTINTNGTFNNYGIFLLGAGAARANVTNNTVVTAGTSSDNYGIYASSAPNATIAENSVTTGGTGIATGIYVQNAGATFARVQRNTVITAAGTGINRGIRIVGAPDALVENNAINTSGTIQNDGIQVSGGLRTLVQNNVINVTATGDSNFGISILSGSTDSRTLNNTVSTNGGSNNYGISLNSVDNVTIAGNNVSTGSAVASGNRGISVGISDDANVYDNIILPGGVSDNYGIIVSTGDRVFINNNSITTRTTGVSNYGIYVIVAQNTTAANTTIVTNGSSGNPGLFITTSAIANTFDQINITSTGTSGANHGIYLASAGINNKFSNITINATGPAGSNGISISAADSATFENITIDETTTTQIALVAGSSNHNFSGIIMHGETSWITTDAGSSANFTFTRFNTTNGSIIIVPTVVVPGSATVSQARLNVTNNRAFLNSTALSFLNTSAQIILENISFTDPQPRVDFEDDGSFTSCSEPQCTEVSYVGSTFVFNVSSFTTYISAEPESCPGTITTDWQMNESVSANDTCVTFGADNIELDCQGYTINYSATANGNGVLASGRSNVTVRNCIILKTNVSTSASSAILYTNTDDSLVVNVTVNATGSTSAGVELAGGSARNAITNSSLNSSAYPAVFLFLVQNATLQNVTGISTISIGINSFGGGNHTLTNVTARGGTNAGIQLDGDASDIRINGFSATTGSGSGISQGSGRNILIENGTANAPTGIIVSLSGQNITLGNVSAQGTNQIAVSSSNSRQITIRNVSASSSATSAIRLDSVNDSVIEDSIGFGTFALRVSGHRNRITRSQGYDSAGGAGIGVTDGDNNTIEHSLGAITSGSGPGILLQRAFNTTITNSSGYSPTAGGISLQFNTNYTRVTHSIGESAANGIEISSGNSNFLFNTTGRANTSGTGISVQDGNNTLANVSGTSSSGAGISIGSSGNTLENSSAASSTGNGLSLFAGSNNITNNTLTSASSTAVLISSGSNILTNNTANTTGTAYSVGSTLNYLRGNTALNGNGFSVGNNHTLTENTALGGTGYGISTGGTGNLIENNTFTKTTAPQACIFSSSTQNIVRNNTCSTSSISPALGMTGGSRNTFIDNIIINANTGGGIQLRDTQHNTLINNTASTTGGGIGIQILGSGVYTSFNHTVINNTGISGIQYGIELDYNTNSYLFGNRATRAMRLDHSHNNTVVNTTINSTGLSPFSLVSSENNTIVNSTISTATLAAIALTSTTLNNSFENTYLESNGTWITTDGTSTGNNITATNFSGRANGTIFITGNATLPASASITQASLRIAQGRAFLNASALSFLNTSAQITLNSITFNQAQPIVSYDDSRAYVACVPPDCTPISYDGSTLVFNVSHFTTFISTIGGVNVTFEKTDNPDPLDLTTTTLLNYTITFNVTDGAAFNATINETYPANTSFVTSNPLPDAGNFSWIVGNVSINTSYQINITLNVSPALANGTVLSNVVNVTFQNSSGDALFVNVTENTTVANELCPLEITTSTTLTENISCPGTAVNILANNVVLDCAGFTINYSATDIGAGINTTQRNNITIANCTVLQTNTSISSAHAILLDQVTNSTVTDNFVNSTTGVGIYLDGNNTNITDNTATSDQNYSIFLTNSRGNRLQNNTATSTSAHAIALFSSSNNNDLINNTGQTSTTEDGIILFNSDSNRLMRNTGISNQGRGIDLVSASLNNLTQNTGFSTDDRGISVSSSPNTILISNNATGTNFRGLVIEFGDNNVIRYNNATSTSGFGFYLDTSNNNEITNNTINSSTGIGAQTSGANNNNFTNNTFTGSGAAAIFNGDNNRIDKSLAIGINNGLVLSGGTGNNLTNNYATHTGAGGALQLASLPTYNLFENNTWYSSSGIAAHIIESAYNEFRNDNISSNTGTALNLLSASNNNTFTDVALFSNNTWIQSDADSFENNLTRTLFNNTATGGILISSATIPASVRAGTNNLSIQQNRAFINSTALPFLNTSAQITLAGLSTGTVQPLVDFDDDGTFAPCTAPQCTFISYAGGTFVFNVSSFTSYTSTDGGVTLTLTKTDTPDPLDLTTTTELNYTITVNVTSGVAHNLTINETYPANVSFASATPAPDFGNFSWNAGNLSNGSTYQINITLSVGTTIPNGSILTNTVNATYQNSTGNSLFTNVTENTTVENVLCPYPVTTSTTLSANITCPATAVNILADNVVLDCAGYTVLYANSSSGYGINTTNRNNIAIQNCIVIHGNRNVTASHGIVYSNTNNSLIRNSTAVVGNNSEAILVQLSSRNNTVVNFSASAVDGPGASAQAGIRINTADNNSIINGTANAGNSNPAIHLSSANHNLIQGVVASSGNNNLYAPSGTNNTFLNNTARGTGAGIVLSTNGRAIRNNIGPAGNAFLLSGNNLYISDNYVNGATNGISANGNNATYVNNTLSATVNLGSVALSNSLFANNTFSNAGSFNTLGTNTTWTNNGFFTIGTALTFSGGGNSTFTDTLLSTNTTWIEFSATSQNNTFTNTTFRNSSGDITFGSNFTLPNGTTINIASLRISPNKAFLNSTNLSFLNTSAQITLSGLALTTPEPIVDFNDDGLYQYCSPPQCTFVSFGGGTLVYNVSSFTGYSSAGNVTLTKTDNPDPVTSGNTLTYQITINNTGADAIFNATLVETYPAGVSFVSSSPAPTSGNNTFVIATIAGSTASTINITLSVGSTLANGTLLNNSANLTFGNGLGQNITLDANETTTVVGVPELVTAKTDTPDPVAKGTTLNYTITVTNIGGEFAYNTTVTETYPSGTLFLSSTPAPTLGNNTFALGTLAPGASTTVNITLNVSTSVANGSVLNNTYNVTFANNSGQNLTITNSTLTTVLGSPVIITIKSDTPDPVIKGTALNYTILINNTGDDTAFNLTITENYPSGVSFATATPAPTLGNNTWNLGTIANGTETTINITVIVGPAVPNGTLLNNTATATFANSTGQSASVNDSELTTVLGIPLITATKTDTPDPATNGTQLNYTITITNTGDEIAYNATVVDGFDANAAFHNSSPAPTLGNNTFILGNLTPGATTTVNITVNISSTFNGTLNNTANVTFQNLSGQTNTQTANASTTVNILAPTPTAPAVTGGGGGGGAGASAVSTTTSFTQNQLTQNFRRNDRITFQVDSELHTITLLEVTTQSVTIEVASTPEVYTLLRGQTRAIDATDDGIPDISVRVIDIFNLRATLFLERLAQPAQQQPAQAGQTIRQPEPVAIPEPAYEEPTPVFVPPAQEQPKTIQTGEPSQIPAAVWIGITLVLALFLAIIIITHRGHRSKGTLQKPEQKKLPEKPAPAPKPKPAKTAPAKPAAPKRNWFFTRTQKSAPAPTPARNENINKDLAKLQREMKEIERLLKKR